MSDVVHRVKKAFRKSVDTSRVSSVDFIINPDLSGVIGVPNKYWNIVGDTITEMSQPEKDAVDVADAAKAADNLEAESQFGIQKHILAALVKTINIRIPGNPITAQELKDAIRLEIDNG